MNDEIEEEKNVTRRPNPLPSILLHKDGSAARMHDLKSEDKALFEFDQSDFKNPLTSPNFQENNVKNPAPAKDKDKSETLGNLEVNINKSSSVYITVILNILFIASFLMEFRISSANKMNFAIQKQIDDYPWSPNPILYYKDISNMEGALVFFTNVILINVLNMNRIYIPQNYNYTLNSVNASNTTNNDLDNLPYYFLNSYNMFKGMKVKCRYIPPDQTEEQVRELFIRTNATAAELGPIFSPFLDELFRGRRYEVDIEIVFLNVVDQIGLFYEYRFLMTEESIFKKSRRVQPFYPKTFDSDFEDSTTKALIIIFRVVFALSLFTQLIKLLAVDILKTVKTLFQTHKLVLPLPLVFNVILTVLLVVVLLLSIAQNVNQSGTCRPLEVIDQTTFELFKSFSVFNKWFNKLLAVTVALMITQILLLLNTKFPTFGVLFYTLGNSKQRLAIYGIVIFTFLAGFVSVATVNFGHGEPKYSSFGNSIFVVFQYFIGLMDFQELEDANARWAKPYFIVFYFVFPLVLLQLFYVIIINTYVSLRKKLQLTTLALAELTAEKSNKLKEKYINLILFRPPKDQQTDDEENKATKTNQKKRNLWEILIYNLEEVDWFGFTNTNQQTRDEIEAEIKQKVEEIRIRKLQYQQKRLEQRKTSLFDQLWKLILHIIFIVIYTLVLHFQLKTTEAFQMEQAISNYFTRSAFQSVIFEDQNDVFSFSKTFYDLSTVEDIKQWMSEIYLDGLIRNVTHDLTDDDTIILHINEQNKIISNAVARVTYRTMKLNQIQSFENPDYNFWIRTPKNIGPSSSFSSDEVSDVVDFTMLADYENITTWLNLPYTPAGSYETFRKKGGYSWTFHRDRNLTHNGTLFVQHPVLLNINTALIALQTVYMNGDSELLGLTEFVIQVETNGYMNTQYSTKTFQINMYSCKGCGWKIFLEILYVLFVLKQTYDILKEWLIEWKKKESKKFTPFNEALKSKPIPSYILNYDMNNFTVMSFIWALGVRIWQTTHRLINTTLRFFKKDYANLVLTLSVVLSYVGFSYYLRMITHDIRDEINLKITPQYNEAQSATNFNSIQLGKLEELATLTEVYATIQAFNSWLIILRLIFALGFIRELSFVLDLIGESLFELLFFIVTFAIIIFGFAIDGYLLFGEESKSFKTLGRSFLQVLLFMFAGPNTNDDETRSEPVTRALYFVLVIIICLLVLLKMFMAIIDGQFVELSSEEMTESRLGFLELIVKVVEEKMKGQKLEILKNMQNLLRKMPENASFFTKMRIWTTNCLMRMRFTFVQILRTFIFGEEEEQLTEEEKQKMRKTFENNKVAMDLKFEGPGEERMTNVNDIDFYLTDNPELKQIEMFEFKEKARNMEDELSLSNKWMSYLEETVSNMTSGHINLSKFGTGARDYINTEYKLNPEVELRFKQIHETYIKDMPPENSLVQYFTDNVAIPEYQRKIKQNKIPDKFFEEIADQIHFIYHHSLTKEEVPIEEEIKLDTEEFRRDDDGSPVEKAFHRDTSIRETKVYHEEAFDNYNGNLLKFWETLKFEHKYELWAGENSDLLSLSVKNCLWYFLNHFLEINEKRKQMKFDATVFKQFVSGELLNQRDDKGLSMTQIGMTELEYIWRILADMSPDTKTTYKENFEYHDLSVKQMQLVEQLVRGNVNNIILKLRNHKTGKEKIKYLSSIKHTKNDQKLMLWLLSSPNLKMELILRIRNSVLSKFTIFLFLEEIYDNSFILQKVEDDLDQEMRNKIYMHFFLFSHFEALQNNYKGHKEMDLAGNDTAVIDYVRFLERQVISTNKTKALYLDEINNILREENCSPLMLPVENAASDPALSRSHTDNEEREILIKKRESDISAPGVQEEKQDTSTLIHRNVENPDSKQDLDNFENTKKDHPKID